MPLKTWVCELQVWKGLMCLCINKWSETKTTQTLAFNDGQRRRRQMSQLCDLGSKALKYRVCAQSVELIPRSSSETTGLSLKLAGGTAAWAVRCCSHWHWSGERSKAEFSGRRVKSKENLRFGTRKSGRHCKWLKSLPALPWNKSLKKKKRTAAFSHGLATREQPFLSPGISCQRPPTPLLVELSSRSGLWSHWAPQRIAVTLCFDSHISSMM